ncbi:ribonuclease H-like domain-containing protein, partial [Tanacetum coccineum]
CMTRSSTKELLSPFENPEQKFRSRKRLFDTPSLVERIHQSSITILTSRNNQRKNGSEQEDANEHIEKVLEIVDLFHIPKVTQDQITLRAFHVSLIGAASIWLRNQLSGLVTTWEVLKTKFLNKYCPPARTAKKMEEINNFQQEPDESLFFILFYNGLDVPTRQILDSNGAILSKTTADAKIAIQEMAEYSQKWHNRTSSRTRSSETFDGLATIQAQLNNLRREIKKVNEKMYAAQFGAPYQPGGQYRAARPGFYQRNNGNSSYPDRRINLEESPTTFMAELAKRHEENSNIIKEIRASTDIAIRNHRASIKTLEIQIGQMSKVLQERGFGSLSSSTETNPRDQVKSISTTKADFSRICHIGCGPYAREAQDVKILDAYDHTLPQKEKDSRSFTLPCFIRNICFDKALVDLEASVSVMPFSTYTNLSLGILSHTRLTIKLADRTIKQPRGIAKNVLVRIGKFIFPIDFIILDIPEDDDVPLILGRPFLLTYHSKIDVFKRKITLRVGEEKLVFKSIKPASSIIKRVFVIKSLDSKTKLIGEGDEPFDLTYGNYIESNDLDTPQEPKTN